MADRGGLGGADLDALLLAEEGPGTGGEATPVPPVPAALPAAKDLLPGSAQHQEATGGAVVTQEQAQAAQLAQMINLHIAGLSLSEIGALIGATADEVDRLFQRDAARYVRTQPALRTYVRNYISGRYSTLLDAVWGDATTPGPRMLDSQDRALRVLDKMSKLHGAEAPTQTEIKVESAPESVEKLVQALSAAQGLGYDAGVFDVIEAEVVQESVTETAAAEAVSGNAVADAQPGDGEGL